MTSAFVSARDYRDGFGAQQMTQDDILDLRKALSAGSDYTNPGTGPGVGFPLRVQSLESTLKNLTFEMDEVKLFKSIPKVPATNTVEEFNRLTSYSKDGARVFNTQWMQEGSLPEEQDSTYERAYVLIKYMGVTGRVTHVMNTIRPAHGNVIAMETMNKTMLLLQQVEHALFFADSSIIPEAWDGLLPLIRSGAPQNVIDLRGAPLTEEALADGMLRIRDAFGQATDLYCATGPFSDLSKQVLDRQRFSVAPAPGIIGATVTAFQGQHGKINLHDSVFIQPTDVPVAAGTGNAATRPNAPSAASPTATTTAGSQFVTADAATYIYKVVAGNRAGKSAPVTTAGVAVVAGDGVSIAITDNGGGVGTSYYEIYRSTPGGAASTCKKIATIARTGASQTFVDLNADLPGTSTAFLLQQNQRSFAWSQLLPFTRIPLAAIDTSIRWAQVLYGAVKMYAPNRNVVFKNVGRLPGSL
jgi:hypothetical protein